MVDLTRTAAALAEYDRREDALLEAMREARTNAEVLEAESDLEALGLAVGVAFGEDTREFNNPVTCAKCVRPGPRVPAIGQELSFVRRMVAKWEARWQ